MDEVMQEAINRLISSRYAARLKAFRDYVKWDVNADPTTDQLLAAALIISRDNGEVDLSNIRRAGTTTMLHALAAAYFKAPCCYSIVVASTSHEVAQIASKMTSYFNEVEPLQLAKYTKTSIHSKNGNKMYFVPYDRGSSSIRGLSINACFVDVPEVRANKLLYQEFMYDLMPAVTGVIVHTKANML